MNVDVHKAYFSAHVDKDIFVELPPEDVRAGKRKKCSKVVKAVYGTRHSRCMA